MSSAPSSNLLTTSIFNPALLGKQDLIRGFVARRDLLDRLLDDLRRIQPGTPPQHQLIVGQRGLGKTTLLRRLAFAIEDDANLSSKWQPLVFPEEQYNVRNLGDFWLNCADALSDALDRAGNTAASVSLDQRVERIPTDPNARSSAGLSLLLEEAETLGRGLVLLVDNLDIVLDRLDREEEWEFRRVISSKPRLYIVGASSRALEALYEHGRAFYDYFQVSELRGLDDKEMFAVLERLAAEANDESVQQLIREKPARIQTMRVLTGGNPRTLMLLYRVLSQGPEGDVQRDLEQLLDLYTPLYKARFEEMAPQAQQVVDAMAIHWDPITAGDLAEQLAPLSVNQVSAQLKRLEDFGVVEKAPWFGEKKTAFQIAERFFNIWYLMRASRRVRRRLIWLVKFLEAWFEREEIRDRAKSYLQRDPKSIGAERFAEMALAYSQTVDDRRLRRNLEWAGLQAALDESLGIEFDFSDLPPEVLDRKQRMERLRGLRKEVLAMNFEGVDSEELWLSIGGSPVLSLKEKVGLVELLSKHGPMGRRLALRRLERCRSRVVDALKIPPAEVHQLHQSIASGEITDTYDVEGIVAVASRLNSKLLPLVAIMSRMGFTPEPTIIIEKALNTLAAEPGYEGVGFYALAAFNLNLERYSEAEQALLQASKFDKTLILSDSWTDLGEKLERLPGHEAQALRAFGKAAELDPTNPVRRSLALRAAQRFADEGHLPASIEAVSRLLEVFPTDTETKFTLTGLHALNKDWEQSSELVEELAASEVEQPEIWAFKAIVQSGYLEDVIEILQHTAANQRWRPLYEALRAVQQGSALYLRRVAPEIQPISEAILQQIAPDFERISKFTR